MGVNPDGTPAKRFNPNSTVDKAQFGTILSRLIWAGSNDGETPYYMLHLQALNSWNK